MLKKMRQMFQGGGTNQTPNPYYQQPVYQAPPNNYYNQYDLERFRSEIQEMQRQINELGKRLIRIEGYLGIRSE